MKTIVTEIGEGIAYYPELHDWVKSFDIDLGQTKFILTSDEVNDEEKKMLAEFHQDDFKERYAMGECNWETFENAINAVAYRGGKGYQYTIWLYNSTHQIAS